MGKFSVNSSGVAETYRLTQLGWVVASTVSRMKDAGASQIPGWAGYNSLLSMSKPLTEVGALPLLPELAHDVPPAPEAIVEIVRCQCKGNCSSNRCSCKSGNLPCADLFLCSTQCENDADAHYGYRESDDDSDA